MWYCPKCGLECRSKDVLCPGCGASKPGVGRTSGKNNPGEISEKERTENVSSGKRGKSGTKTVAVITALIVAALLIAVSIYVIGSSDIITIKFPDSIEITCNGHTLEELQMLSGEECEINAVFSPEDSNAEPKWSTSDSSVVTITGGDNNRCRHYTKDSGGAEITVICGDTEKVLSVFVSPMHRLMSQ